MYLGQTIWIIRKTNFAIGVVGLIFLLILAAMFLVVVAFILYRTLDKQIKRERQPMTGIAIQNTGLSRLRRIKRQTQPRHRQRIAFRRVGCD